MPKTDVAQSRQRELAKEDFESGDGLTGQAAAGKYGVSESCISLDRRTETYLDERDRLERSPLIRRVKRDAWKLIAGVIEDGNAARTSKPDIAGYDLSDRGSGAAISATINAHQSTIERGTRVGQWALEKLRDFEAESDTTDNAATTLLDAILHGSDHEKEQMRAELAEIKLRLSKLNGIGADVLQGLDTTHTGENDDSINDST